jgi:hydrogenase expression/formation protein HypD
MKYVDEFRDSALAKNISHQIRTQIDSERNYSLMEFCGGHTHAISRFGIVDLLPPNVQLIHGPGCPVCVLPIGRIDMAIKLALEQGVMLCTFADVMRIPASKGLTLQKAKARGADIVSVYSPLNALELAIKNPSREVVFLAIGFETTAPTTAITLKKARKLGITNFSVLSNHVLTPSAMEAIFKRDKDQKVSAKIDGIIGPAHVSIIIGITPYERFVKIYRLPVVIAGFEPLDVMQAVKMLISQINSNSAVVENEFTRAVTRDGNVVALNAINEVFEIRDFFEWRGLGTIPHSALKLSESFSDFDAEKRFDLNYKRVLDHKDCECGAILKGEKRPQECKIFGTSCTPETPIGSCMVSSEGACAAHYSFGRFRNIPVNSAFVD